MHLYETLDKEINRILKDDSENLFTALLLAWSHPDNGGIGGWCHRSVAIAISALGTDSPVVELEKHIDTYRRLNEPIMVRNLKMFAEALVSDVVAGLAFSFHHGSSDKFFDEREKSHKHWQKVAGHSDATT
jgi:hypothetical protein